MWTVYIMIEWSIKYYVLQDGKRLKSRWLPYLLVTKPIILSYRAKLIKKISYTNNCAVQLHHCCMFFISIEFFTKKVQIKWFSKDLFNFYGVLIIIETTWFQSAMISTDFSSLKENWNLANHVISTSLNLKFHRI